MIRVKLSGDAIMPTKSHDYDAGWDLYAIEHATLMPGVHAVLPTGVRMAIPAGFAGLIWPRSGMAAKHGIDTLAGVVDAGYRGEVKVSLINHGHDPVEIKPGDRIAQMIIQLISMDDMSSVDDLDNTDRGHGGFGSTGV